jgi:hypothetical protein
MTKKSITNTFKSMQNLTLRQTSALAKLTIGHRHLEARAEEGLEVETTCRFGGDEGMRGAGVNKGGDDGVAKVNKQLHYLSGGNAIDGVEGDMR